jgi:hypothetical protein
MQEEESNHGSTRGGTPAATLETSETPSLDETQKGLMSPITPAPSPTPGRHGYWGTVGRGDGEGSEGERKTRGKGKGKAREGEDESSDEMEGIVSGSYGTSYLGVLLSRVLHLLADPATFIAQFPSLPAPTRLALLQALLPILTVPELLMLSSHIGPRLKRDFLRELPMELALHILSFVSQESMFAGLKSDRACRLTTRARWRGLHVFRGTGDACLRMNRHGKKCVSDIASRRTQHSIIVLRFPLPRPRLDLPLSRHYLQVLLHLLQHRHLHRLGTFQTSPFFRAVQPWH